jgi:hypothetical protein
VPPSHSPQPIPREEVGVSHETRSFQGGKALGRAARLREEVERRSPLV